MGYHCESIHGRLLERAINQETIVVFRMVSQGLADYVDAVVTYGKRRLWSVRHDLVPLQVL